MQVRSSHDEKKMLYWIHPEYGEGKCMELKKVYDGSKLTVFLAGKLDTESAPKLNAELAASLGGITELVLDMTDLSYISSAGLRTLLSAQQMMNRQGRMVLRGVRESIRDVFRITGFLELLTLE